MKLKLIKYPLMNINGGVQNIEKQDNSCNIKLGEVQGRERLEYL